MIAGYYQANERVKDARCVGPIFPSVCSLSSYLGLCQQQSSPQIRRVWFPLTAVSCFHIVSVGLRDVAFGQVQKVQALQNPSSPAVAAIKGHSLNECQPLELQLSGKKPKSAECLPVQYGSCKVWRLPGSYGKSGVTWFFLKFLIIAELFQSLFLRGEEVEDDVKQAVISLIYHFFSSGLVIFFPCWLTQITH